MDVEVTPTRAGWRWKRMPQVVLGGVAALGLLAGAPTLAGAKPAPTGRSTTTTSTTVRSTTATTAPATTTTTAPVTTTTASTSTTTGVAGMIGGAWDHDDAVRAFTEWNTTRSITRYEATIAIGAAAAHYDGWDGTGIGIALVDTGIAPVGDLALPGTIVNGPDLSLDYQAGLPAGLDANGHGTHLAGIAAGRYEGVAPAARLVNLKVGAADGAVDVSQVIAAIDWAVTHRNDPELGIRVLNLAFGTDSVQPYQVSPLAHAVESAWRNGIVVVVAAGNGGPLLTPAIDPFVLTVGAADLNGPFNPTDDTLAPFSSVGTTARPVDLLGPGSSILSLRTPGSLIDLLNPTAVVDFLGQQYFKGSGTSQAAAFVSGAAAVLLEQRPNLTPDQVKAILKGTADPLSGVPATAQGAGLVDVDGALDAPTPNASSARQRMTFSTGTGSLDADRGTARLIADDGTVLAGELDIQGAPWKGSVWGPLSTAGTAWNGGVWNGNVWTGTTWSSATSIEGALWSGRSWRSELWTGRSWRADLWTGRSWRDALWEGRAWRGDGWY